MDKKKTEELVSRLSLPLNHLLREAMNTQDPALWKEAFTQAGFSTLKEEKGVYIRPESLSFEQGIIASLSAHFDFYQNSHALPFLRVTRERWLGLSTQGVLEQEFEVVIDNKPDRDFLWRLLQKNKNHNHNSAHIGTILSGCVQVLNALPLQARLQAITELYDHPREMTYHYGIDAPNLLKHPDLHLLNELKDEGATWSPRRADRIMEMAEIKQVSNPHNLHLSQCIKKDGEALLVFLALVRAGIPIEPRWYFLVPLDNPECLQAIPEAQRTDVITSILAESNLHFPDSLIKRGLLLMESFPSEELLALLLKTTEKAVYTPQRILLEKIKSKIKNHVALYMQAEKFSAELPPVEKLYCLSEIKPDHLSDLSEIQREQLQRVFKNWDGEDLAVEERFKSKNPEVCIQNNLTSLIVLGNKKGNALYDVYLLGGDGGSIYHTGTTELAATLIQGSLQSNDKKLKEAIELALYLREELPR